MFRIQRGFLEILGAILMSVYLSTVVYMAIKGVMVTILLVIIVMPFYGLYRVQNGRDNTKGLRYYLLPIFNILRKLIIIKHFSLVGYLIVGVIAISIYKRLMYEFVCILVALFIYCVIWGITRYLFKQLKYTEIPSFLEVIRLAF